MLHFLFLRQYRLAMIRQHFPSPLWVRVVNFNPLNSGPPALLMFAAAYAQRHPQLAMGLFQYCEIVRDIAHTGPPMGWRLYDEQFCSLRQSAPGNFPWDQPRWDLYFKTMYAKPAQNNSSHPFSSTVQHANRTSFSTGYCWPFQWAHVRRSNAVTTSFELIPFRPLSSKLNTHPCPPGTAGHSNGAHVRRDNADLSTRVPNMTTRTQPVSVRCRDLL